MNKDIIGHFESTWREYDGWYETHSALYQSELAALKRVVPSGEGLEIGVGTGRFAAPLGVRVGLDPAINMLRLAKKRGIMAVQGMGESLPFRDRTFDFVQIVFVIEFIPRPDIFLMEAVRTIRPNGSLILSFIDRESLWGQFYAQDPSHQGHFHPFRTEEVLEIFARIGLEFREAYQTLLQPPPDIGREEEPMAGFGRGGVVILKVEKREGT
jgi:ubiquinone/menaquinone biosynthesis C-methylase UbiE